MRLLRKEVCFRTSTIIVINVVLKVQCNFWPMQATTTFVWNKIRQNILRTNTNLRVVITLNNYQNKIQDFYTKTFVMQRETDMWK